MNQSHPVFPSCAVVGWLLLLSASTGLGQQYPFLPIPGAPKNIEALFQDSRGRLWLAGEQVACFDGTRFFFLKDYGFPNVPSLQIIEDPDGAIWIQAIPGIFRFSGGHVERVSDMVAQGMVAAAPGVLVAAQRISGEGDSSNSALVRIERNGNSWHTTTLVSSLDSPGPLFADPAGMLLYPAPGKGWNEIRLQDALHWRPGNGIGITRHSVPGYPRFRWTKVRRDHLGCVWLSAPSGDTYDCGKGPQPIDLDASLENESPDGNVILRGHDLLVTGRPGAFQIATPANGLPWFVDGLRTQDGTIWLGATLGLYRFPSPFRLEYWTARDGVATSPWSIARSGNRVYTGLSRRIIALSQDRTRWETFAGFPQRGDVMALLGAADGTLLAAFKKGGTALLNPTGTVVANSDGPPFARRLVRTDNGEVWLGADGLSRLTRKGPRLEWQNVPLEHQPSGLVLGLKYESHNRRLWACYNGGLVVKDESGPFREYTTRDGLLVNGCWSVAPLPNGGVWYAYYGPSAIALLKPNSTGGFTVRSYGANSGLIEPGGDTLDTDGRGWLWRSFLKGIYVATPSQAEAGRWLQLNQTDGFPDSNMNTGSFFADTDQSLWFGLNNSLVHYVPPPDLVLPHVAPQIFISAFSWEKQPPKLAEAVTVTPHGAQLIVHIGSLQFDRRNALWLRYRLLPEQSWHETNHLDLALGALATGPHTLEVQGRIFDGPWSPVSHQSFTVARSLWMTWPLLAGYFLCAVALLAGIFLLLRKRLSDQQELLPDLAAWRLGALLPEAQEIEGASLDSRFEVGQLLARGGFANVMDGYDHLQKQRCAIKVFRGEVRDKEWIQRRFEQEVAALQKVRHPNVVSIYAHGNMPSGGPYLVMEFVPGRSLREILDQGALSPQRTARLLEQLAGALDAIHAQEIFHRDVKPENVIIRNEGLADEESVLIDFSIAIVKDANETLYGLSRAAGSFDYMAPEQAVGYADASSDIYSLAKVVIEMLTGRRLSRLLPNASLDLPDRLRELLTGSAEIRLSAESIDILVQAFEFDPSRRPRIASLFARPIVADLE